MSLKYAILVLLKSEPRSGYDLAQAFKQTLGNFWNASHQQIYQELKKLSEEGSLEYTVEHQQDKPDRKVYTLTTLGVQGLQSWLRLPVKPPRINDALLVKIYGATCEDYPHLRTELALHRHIHEEQLQRYQRLEQLFKASDSTARSEFQLPYLTLRRGILAEQAWLQWADEMAEALQ